MNENIPKPLSEKEILELFEKMMVRILIHCKMFDVKALALAYVHGTKCVWNLGSIGDFFLFFFFEKLLIDGVSELKKKKNTQSPIHAVQD